MARTYHHDKKRYHPWENPRANHKVLVRYLTEVWNYSNPWRVSFHYVDYSASGPSHWRKMQMEAPFRSAVHAVERKFRNKRWHSYLPGQDCPADCEGCAVDKLECQCQLDDLYSDPWPVYNRPQIYYW